ncbi:unnamed protein product [Mucor hiemalis]
MGFMKKFFNFQHPQKDASNTADSTPTTSNAATPTTSNAATPITSPAGSIIDVDAQTKPIPDRYHNDPMRISKRPDTIGNFLDPMGGHGSYSVSKDVTNTGA